MALNINSFKTGSSVPPMEAGTYPAVCYVVADLGVQPTTYDGQEKHVHQVLISWEFPDELIEYQGEMKPRVMSQTFTASTSEMSKLRKWLKSWRGRDFTAAELADFNIANVLGAPCLLSITQTEKNGNVYANISGISKAMKGQEVKPPTKKVHFDIDEQDTWPDFAHLPEWVQRKINESLTLKERGIIFDSNGNAIDSLAGISSTPIDTANVFTEITDDGEDLPF